MGKSLKGKELGKGISQRKSDGLYTARFTNRFGKRQSVYAKTYNGVQKKLREAILNDDKEINVVSSKMTLDEWYEQWMDTCKINCRNNSKETYAKHYKRVKDALGWRRLDKLNLVIMQKAINDLSTDNQRKNSKKVLMDMLDKALASDLITKNVAKQSVLSEFKPDKGYENLVFVTKKNKPTTQFLVTQCIRGVLKKIHEDYPDIIFEK